MNCFQGAKDLINGKLNKSITFVAIEGETHFGGFAIHINNDIVIKNKKEIIGGWRRRR